jgi:POT family proton-dependent oligopeptide transporter
MLTAKPGELFGHPKGLYVLFFTEMWERFCFYSMRAYIVLYMTQALLFSQKVSNGIYGAYLGIGYASTFIGGILADRLIGQRRAIYLGGTLMAVAQFALAAHALLIPAPIAGGEPKVEGLFVGLNMLFFLALGLFDAGQGFFKPNISTIVGSLYEQGDPRRDGAFTIFYMGINIGAALAGFSGQISETVGWHWGFFLAGGGMILAQIIFYAGREALQGKGLPPRRVTPSEAAPRSVPNALLFVIGIALFVPVAAYSLARPAWVQNIAAWFMIPVLLYLLYVAFRGTTEERGRMIVIIVLCCFCTMFWAFFELAGSAINLFANERVDRVFPLIGELKSSALTASINPIFIVALGIPFARLWVWLDKRRMEPPSPLKFALGLAQLGAGFFILYLGAAQAGTTGKCNVMYLVLGFFLHTTGELCLSPVGLSTITKLSPARIVGMFMGVWFLFTAMGYVVGGWVGGLTEHSGYAAVFKLIAIIAVAAGVLLGLLSPFLKKMMHGVK